MGSYDPKDQAPPPYTSSPITDVTDDDDLGFLKIFDTVFLIDDSGSMAGSSWEQTAKALEKIAPICTEYDADGIDIYFLNHRSDYKNVTSASTIIEIFQTVQPSGGTLTGGRLYDILAPYLRRFEENKHTKPLNIIVITDGASTDDVGSVLVSAALQLDAQFAKPWQVGMQFFQVGNEPGARDFLERLDDDLHKEAGSGGNGTCRDMVDTTPFTGELTADKITKVLIGSVHRRWDKRPN